MNKQVNTFTLFKTFKAFKRINTAFHHSLTLIRAKKAAFAAFNCVLRHFIPFWYM